MSAKRPAGVARIEERIIAEWSRYAARQAGSADRVAAGTCYLEARPCPFAIPQPPKKEDFYYIHDIEWAGGKDNYSEVGSAALGPVKVWLENRFAMRRSEFMFRVDGGAPGSAGCVCVTSIGDLKKLVALLRKYNPRRLHVEWGL